MRRSVVSFVAFSIMLVVACACSNGGTTATPSTSVSEFEQRLESLRDGTKIAAITAVIAKGQQVVWSRGFGLADIATQRSAADTTVYHLASLTKPFASTVLLQLVEEGKVSLDDPVTKYGISMSNAVHVRHLLSMTSEGTPGTQFRYNGDRFAALESVISSAAGQSFAAALQERIIARIGLNRTAPNPQSAAFSASGLNKSTFEANMARGYTYSARSYTATNYPNSFGAAAGLTSSALDVAAFSMSMDRDALLRPETRTLAWTPTVTPSGATLPYALGWFSTTYKGVRVIWHYGYWTANSSLIVKVPERELTFVVLANTDGLSRDYELGSGKLDSSPWAREFLDTFVIGSVALP